jgi:hypothetical protein
MTMLTGILLIPILWLLKAGAYWGAFRIRKIEATAMNCLTIAGAAFVMSIVPFALPEFLEELVKIALAVGFTLYLTEAEPYPDGILIPFGVELLFLGAQRGIAAMGLLR